MSLAKAAMAGAVIANSGHEQRPQAIERRCSAIEPVTPLRTRRLGSAAVPRARREEQRDEVHRAKNAEGLQEGLDGRAGRRSRQRVASSPGATGVSPP